MKNIKNTYKVVLQYLFNVVILLKTVFYLKLKFILKKTQKLLFSKTWKNSENLEEIYQKHFATLFQGAFKF